MFFTAQNLAQFTVTPTVPWEWQPPYDPPAEVRSSKTARQDWYKNKQTRWSFYTPFEGTNPNQRVSKSNPPRFLWGFSVDYDTPIDDQRLDEEVSRRKIKPAWLEQSLGGNARFVYLFPRPLPIDSLDFACYFLEKAVAWLQLEGLPCFDRPAFVDPTRLLANGGVWRSTGCGPIAEDVLQTFFVKIGASFRHSADSGIEIPLEIVEAKLKEAYPNFSWPGPFELESKGASFWIPESQSTASAILKPEGFFTFSAHAEKPFYSWEDLLGAEFVEQFTTTALAKATTDLWFDSKKFYRQKRGCYVGMEMPELANYLKTTCGIKGPKLELALSHIYSECAVESVGPFIFRPKGLIEYQGKRVLNTADVRMLQPAADTQTWGPSGNFPFLSSLLDSLFTTDIQRDNFLAWWRYFYECGLNQTPAPGQVLFLAGGVNTGKTLTSREIVGRSVGGFVDASSYLVDRESFNSHVFEKPLWVMDDEAISDSPQAAATVQAALKKATANSSHLSNRKFQTAGMVEWMGRIIITTNTDYASSRMLGKLDSSSRDKISLFRCQPVSKIVFPSRPEILKLIDAELAFLLRWLLDWTPPDYVERDVRFGYKSYHEESLIDQAHQTSRSAPFQELLIEALDAWFADNPKAESWRGTSSRVLMLLNSDPARETVLKSLRIESTSRYLESVERDGVLKCHVDSGRLGTRVWVFPRFEDELPSAPALPPQSAQSIFTQ